MTKDEALRLALEALKAADWYIDQLEMVVYCVDDEGTHENRAKVQAAIAAIEEYLQPPNPPKRPWRPMTEEEKDGLLLPFGSYGELEAIEAKLKEIHGV